MKIWIINHYATPPELGGLNRHFYFAKYLQKKGHAVKIFSASKIHNSTVNMICGKETYKKVSVDGVRYIFIRTGNYVQNGIRRIINMLEFPLRMWRICGKMKAPDIIYTSSPDILTMLAAVLLAKRRKIKCVVEVRDLYPESLVSFGHFSRRNPVIQILYHLETWIYKNADSIIFTMEGGRDYIRLNKPKVRLEKVHYINNGIDLEEFDLNKTKYVYEDDDLNAPDKQNLIYTGSIRKAYDLQLLMRCAKLLVNDEKIQFLIFGEGTELEEIKQMCSEQNIHNVKFKGFVSKKYMPYILSKSFLNLMHCSSDCLSEYGCSQNKLFEYMASGKPILSNNQMAYDIVQKYNCGLSEDLYDAESYKQAIMKFIHMPSEEYAKLCENNLEAAKLFDYKKLTERLEQILLNT